MYYMNNSHYNINLKKTKKLKFTGAECTYAICAPSLAHIWVMCG